MDDMNRERFEDLKDAYVLGALSAEEAEEVRSYLAAYPELQAETDELAGVVSLLALSASDREPPKSLRKSLMQTVEREASNSARSEDRATARDDRGSPLAALVGYLRSTRPLVLGAAGLLLVGLLSWNVLLQGQLQTLRDDNSDLQARIGNLSSEDAQTSRVLAMNGEGEMERVEAEVVSYDRGQAVLVAKNMPQVSSGKTYQIWVLKNGEANPSGLFEPESVEDGTVAAYVNQSLEGADAVAVTVEPQGGSQQPTSDPQLLASL